MRGFFHEGHWYEDTGMTCRRCGHPVYRSDLAEYAYQCFHCDEDLYSFEAMEPDGAYVPPVMVARPVGGIALNEGLEYLLDDAGKPRIFAGWREAEAYLLGHGVAEADLETVYFIEIDEEDGKDSGCAFKVVDADGVRYYTSPEVLGLADFAQSLHENERDGGGSPLPLAGRIAGAAECPEAAWLAMADDMEAEEKFSCFLIADIVGNVLWVNEDHGDGLAHYVFPLSAVLEAAAMEGDVWALLLVRFPNARVDR